ncbi:lipopolysaccharide heptosyltransferase II [Candidatus Babeliales bacterium]|nr:lipopolysaccharide heptosyltransferase II [Candidatus Babeliales bacterium]
MSTPALKVLRELYPEAHITAMCQSNVSDILISNPYLDEIWSYKKPENRKEKKEIINLLKEKKFDLGILFTNSLSSAWWFFRGRVKERVGFASDMRSLLLTEAVPFPKNRKEQHLIFTYLLLFKSGSGKPVPELFVTAEEEEKAKKILIDNGLSPDQKILGISPGAAFGSAKCWLPERFKSLAERFTVEDNVQVVCLGHKSEIDLGKTICQSSKIINLVGKTSLRELLAIISVCDAFLANDSGPMHIAAALKIPLVAIFGPTDEKISRPYPEGVVLRKNLSCSPCHLRECPQSHECMKGVSVNEVYRKLKNLLVFSFFLSLSVALSAANPSPSILLLCTAKAFGGAENHALSLFKNLSNCGGRVMMGITEDSSLAEKTKKLSKELNKNIITIKRCNVNAMEVAKKCIEKDVEIIQCNEEKEIALSYEILKAGRWRRKPSIVLTRHVLSKCKKGTLEKIDAAIAVSSPIVSYLEKAREALSGNNFRIAHIPPLYEIDKYLQFFPSKKTKHDFFKEEFDINIENNQSVICMIANLYRAKNHKLLLNAISKIKASKGLASKSIHLVLAGNGPLEKKLKALSRKLKISDRTHFVGFTNKIPEILSYSDVNILPTKKEGLGIALIEASLMKKPSIIASGSGSSDVIKDKETGLIFKNNDLNDCIEKINYIIDNPKIASRLGAMAYKFVKKQFSIKNSLIKYINLYKTLQEAA